MPDIDGFGVLELLQDWKPFPVLVTAYEAYAGQAGALNAIDYLLKPVDHWCLRRALDRVRERMKFADVAKSGQGHCLKARTANAPRWQSLKGIALIMRELMACRLSSTQILPS